MADSIQRSKEKSINFLTFVLLFQVVSYLIVFWNIPIARQAVGFFYLTFIPGMIILKILKLNETDTIGKILFSVGLSIAFLMIIGLLVSELGTLAGISNPLSIVPLMILLNSVILLLGFLGYLREKDFRFSLTENGKLSLFTFFMLGLPLLSVVGAIWVNSFGNNFILLSMIVIISGIVILIILSKRRIQTKHYPLAILVIAIALLFHSSLISSYIYGHDIHFEYYVFKSTQNDSHWNSTVTYSNVPAYISFNGMLSITVLPTIYSNILGMEATWVFKIIYPLIFAFVPLGLYQLFKMHVGKKIAFLSSFFFISNASFFTELLSLSRQMVAELFFVLLFLVLLNKKMNPFSKKLIFVIFSFALVVSHYSTAYVFMFIIFLAWLLSFLRKTRTQGITASSVALFFIIAFSWYIYTSGSGPFNGLLNAGDYISRSVLTDFFSLGSRGELVLRGLGLESAPSFWHLMSRGFAYITEFFILFGFITYMLKRERNVFDKEYMLISSLNMVLLIMNLIVPRFASSINMSRFYHLELFFLAPFCILGGESFVKSALNRLHVKNTQLSSVFLLLVFVLFFLFQTGFVYEVASDDSWSVPLSGYRMGDIRMRLLGFPNEQDLFGVKWVSKNTDVQNELIYADPGYTHFEFASYGMINIDKTVPMISKTTILEISGTLRGTVFLGRVNVVDGIFNVYGQEAQMWNTTEITPILNNMNKIYSNGDSEIYHVPP